jgi:hypothetical protein
MKTNIHVVPRDGDWAVKEGAQRDSSHHCTQAEAINAAKQTAQREGTEMFVHGRNGQIRERNTYGYDPFPPKG